jgi:hypothetical protein
VSLLHEGHFADVAYCRVHPAIGIARVGNSPDKFFIGPERPGVSADPEGGYKDNGDPRKGVPPRIKRQAARFRIFAFDKDHHALGEVTSISADITWTVHLANKKAEWDTFAGTTGEDLPLGERRPRDAWRNARIEDRESLIIDPGEKILAKPSERADFSGGKFRGLDVPLGHAETDSEGRLLVLGGFGNSNPSRVGAPIRNYANNDFWHDDVSDGPVKATVVLKDGRTIDVVKPSWVIVAPPDFAPAVMNIVTLYDVALDTALQHGLKDGLSSIPSATLSFTRDVYPIFSRFVGLQWVQQSILDGRGTLADLADPKALSDAGPDPAVIDRRKRIFNAFRNPNLDLDSQEAQEQAKDLFLPALSGDSGDAVPGQPRRWLRITKTQYQALSNWVLGNFVDDWKGVPLPDPEAEITPEGLDRAALEACAGGAFYPGIEAGWILRNPAVYSEPFRFSHSVLLAGDVTRRMACPWQADFYECNTHWWPAQRPDEVLTYETFVRIAQMDDKLANTDPLSSEYSRLKTERDMLWSTRTAWARGLPEQSYAGDVGMIEHWHQHGFIAEKTKTGPIELHGVAQRVECDRGEYDGLSWAEYFHLLTNIERYPQFVHKARELALQFFAGADFEADPSYAPFRYSPVTFDRRMQDIYDAFVRDMNDPSWLDSGKIQHPVVVRYEGDAAITRSLDFDLGGAFSDRVVKERIRQGAPFNLVDGAWLQRIQSAGPADSIREHLFSIWDDEAGNGRTEQNHCNVYDTLLRSVNIYMPAITAKAFIEQDFLPSAFIQPVFQLSVGLFPDEFFPELLGMTLYLEWEATPTLTPAVRMLQGRRIDPHFYSLHVAIDNITAGHGALAKDAIKLYLQKIEDEGGDVAVQDTWERIWRGYVTWATAGDLGAELQELSMILDHKKIDLSYPLMLTPEMISEPAGLLASFKTPESNAVAAFLSEQFGGAILAMLQTYNPAQPPSQALLGTIVDELNRIAQTTSLFEETRFAKVTMAKDTLELLGKHPTGENLIRLNRLLLRDAFSKHVAEIPKLDPNWFPDEKAYYRNKMIQVIRKKAPTAQPMHWNVNVSVKGQPRKLAELFDDPDTLLDALVDGHWFDTTHPRDSRFFKALEFSGPMYKIFSTEEQDVILRFVESLAAPPPPAPPPDTPVDPKVASRKVEQFILDNAAFARSIGRHEGITLADSQGQPKALKDWFLDAPGLMSALVRNGWVKSNDSGGSPLYKLLLSSRMSTLGSGVAQMFKDWIDSGAVAPAPQGPTPLKHEVTSAESLVAAAEFGEFSTIETPDFGESGFPALTFSKRRRLIGMGAVH